MVVDEGDELGVANLTSSELSAGNDIVHAVNAVSTEVVIIFVVGQVAI